MKAAKARGQQGIALLLVLVALTILGAMTADFMETNEVYLATTVNARDAVKAEYVARSGVNLGRLLLSFQAILGKSVNFPFWQYADMVISTLIDSEGEGGPGRSAGVGLPEGDGSGLEDGDMGVTIVDEDSKINVNLANDRGGRASERMVGQLVALMAPVRYDSLFDRDVEGDESTGREDLLCEFIDWSDPDEDLCDMSGSEDRSFYQSQEPAYERKNAPFDSLEELHLLKGMDDDIWSALVEPDAESPESRVLTVWGKGKVNVNTAPPQVLFPLVCMLATGPEGINPCLDPMQSLNLLQILQAVVMLRTFFPFNSVSDFISAVESPESRLFVPLAGFPMLYKQNAKNVFSTRSTVFSIYGEGSVGRVTKKVHVVVDMEGIDMLDPTNTVAASGGSVLYWHME